MKKRIITGMLILMMCQPVQQAYAQDFMYCDDVYSMAEEICKPYKVSPELVQAIIWTESRYDTEAKNGTCIGLMQINYPAHEGRMERLGVTDLENPYDNIRVGVDYLAELFNKYEDTAYVLDLYNGKSTAESNYKNGIVSTYAKNVCKLSAELEKEHGK